MRLVLIGGCEESVRLVRAWTAAGHPLVAAYGCPEPWSSELVELGAGELGRGADNDDDWQSLLHGTVADAVIFARQSQTIDREDALRKLVGAKIPLVVIHPPCIPIVAIELDMIRRDTHCPIVPYYSGRGHPVAGEITAAVTAGQWGTVEQVVFERPPFDDQEAALEQFARDIEWLRAIVGDMVQVLSSGTSQVERSGNLTISMTSEYGASVRWSTNFLEADQSGKIVVSSSEQTHSVVLRDNDAVWAVDDRPPVRWDDEPAALLAELQQQIADSDAKSPWSTATRGLEIVDAAQHSLQRRRSIDLHFEEHTEEGSFKGIMAAGGCGLLLLSLLALFLFAVFEGFHLATRPDVPGAVAAPADPEADSGRWPLALRLWPFYPFAAYLALQLFRLVFMPPRPREALSASPAVPDENLKDQKSPVSTDAPTSDQD